jgi:hypothetical protein
MDFASVSANHILQKNFKRIFLYCYHFQKKMRGKGCSRRKRALIREKYQEGKTVCKHCEEYQLHKATVYWILAETSQVPRKHGHPTKLSQHE